MYGMVLIQSFNQLSQDQGAINEKNISRVPKKTIKAHIIHTKNMTVRMHMQTEDSKFFGKMSMEEICLMCGGRLYQA